MKDETRQRKENADEVRRPGSLRLFRLRGIDLNVHVSLILLLIYVVFVAGMQFQLVARGAGMNVSELAGSPLQWGLVFAIGLFSSVALHEFGHAFVAQALGVKVRGITLMMLGGVSEMEKMPERPYAEFKLAIIGPIVSFALAGLLYVIRTQTTSPEIFLFSYWLGTANLALAIFNLIPAFPLDGGRALRSLLAVRNGPYKATETAVNVSRVLAWGLGIIGFIQFNLLLLIIAFFIHAAARNELFIMSSRQALGGVKVSEVMRKLEPLSEDQLIRDAAERMLRERADVLPVVAKGDGVPSLVSLEDLRRVSPNAWSVSRVREVMQRASHVLRIDGSIEEILPELIGTRSHAMPVVSEAGHPMGIVRYEDVADVLKFRTLVTGNAQDGRRKEAS